MHNYTHEYKMVKAKGARKPHPQYVGSRCSTETCPDNRRPTMLDVVKRHNDQTGDFFGTTGNTRTVRGA